MFFKDRDIRGIYGLELSEKDFFNLGLVLDNFSDTLILGMDYRIHNDTLCKAMVSGFNGEISYLGNATSPMVAYLSAKLGICLTASHNPPEYNGAKFFKDKRSFFGDEMIDISNYYYKIKGGEYKLNERKLKVDIDLKNSYLDEIPEIDVNAGIFDLCGGAACSVRDIFPNRIYDIPDPLFERHSPDPCDSALHELKKITVFNDELGFAFDCDGDRVVIVGDGKVIGADIIIAYVAENYLKKGDAIVMSLDCRNEVYNYIENLGLKPYYAAVGQDALIKKAFEVNANFTGEQSHHFSFTKFMPYSDAIYFAAVFSKTKPKDILNFEHKFKNVVHQETFSFQIDFTKLENSLSKKSLSIDKSDGIKATFEDYCVLIRSSKTEPLIRVSIEAEGSILKKVLKVIREEVMNVKVGEMLRNDKRKF